MYPHMASVAVGFHSIDAKLWNLTPPTLMCGLPMFASSEHARKGKMFLCLICV